MSLDYEPNPNAEDEGYEKARQEEVDALMIVYPNDATLAARGKYSTLASERRELLKAMREELETIVTYAGRTLRSPDAVDMVGLQIDSMRNVHENLKGLHARLCVVHAAMKDLKPSAWGDKHVE